MRHLPARLALAALTFATTAIVVTVAERPAVEIGTGVSAQNERLTPSARAGEPVRYDDDDLNLLASYPLRNGEVEGELPPRYRAAWAEVAAIIPAADRGRFRQLNFASDGPSGTLAMVHRSTSVKEQWILSIDPSESAPMLRRTMVHELAHVYTLGARDLTKSRNCDGRALVIGCARTGSTLAQWHDAFWANRSEPTRFDSTAFVTEYAASSVHEDLAETFMVWVYGERPAGPGVEAKYAALAANADLVALSAAVRAVL